MNNWLTRFLSLFLIVIFIGIYQLTTTTRAAEAEVGRLSVELAEAQVAKEALEEALDTVQETLREQAEMASKTGDVASRTGDVSSKTGEMASGTEGTALSAEETADFASANTEPPRYVPGSYEGSGQGFGGEVAVRVFVTEREIADVEILSHAGEDATYFSYAAHLIPDILEEQTWDVDVVSGATFSSNGIKDAVRAALEEASVDE